MEETAVLIERSQAGDKEARGVLIEENLGLVRHIVKRFTGRGYDTEDLFQIGCIGLIKAIDKFDLNFGVRFSTYAVPMIQGEIKRFLRDDGMVKVSRTLKENGWKIKQAAERLSQIYGRDATLQELSAETELSIEDIVMALDANVEVESIYKSVYQSDGNEIYLVDQVVGDGTGCTAGLNRASEDAEKEKILTICFWSSLWGRSRRRKGSLSRCVTFRTRRRWRWQRALASAKFRSAGWRKGFCCGSGERWGEKKRG